MHVASRIAFAAALVALLYLGHRVRLHASGTSFVYAGSDSYGYLRLADELRAHRRYAFGPPPEPLHWARPPVFPIYLALVKGDAEAKMTGGEGWMKIVRANRRLDLFGTGACVGFLGWVVGGPLAALLSLLLMMLSPWHAVAVPAALTETLATFLVAASLALAMPAAMGSRRLGWLVAAGGALALATLTRPDALLLAPGLALAALGSARARQPGRLPRALVGPVAALALGFAVVFLPWPVRNLIAFGHPHPLGGRIDRWSRPVEHYQGSWAFLRAISRDWKPMTRLTTCYYDLGCKPKVGDFLAANETLDEQELGALDGLLAQRRREGHSAAVSDGFAALAARRRGLHPLEVELIFPLRRLRAMWIAHHDEFLTPWSPVHDWGPRFLRWSTALAIAAALGALLLLVHRRLRLAVLVLAWATLGRTAIMAYTFYSMPRYLLESLPSAFVLVGCGVAAAAGWGASAVRRARSRTKATSGVESASMKT